MLKGNMYITTDTNMVLNMLQNYKIVVIGEPDPNFMRQTNAIDGAILLPPYKAVMAEMDNNMEAFTQLYGAHLSSIEPTTFIALLIKALYKGVNILLYLTPEESQLSYSKFFLEYMRAAYGITIGTPTNQYFYNISYNGMICNLLYQLEMFSSDEFFIYYPQGVLLDNNSVAKLIRDINPYVKDTSFESYIRYFNEYKEKVKKNNNRILYNPLQRGR